MGNKSSKSKNASGKGGNSKQQKPSQIVRQIKLDPEVGEYLKRIPLLSSLNSEERMKLGGALVEQNVKKGAFVFKEGDDAKGFYIIKTGELAVVSKSGGEIARLRAGDYFGEAALLSDAKRGAGVQALQKSTVLFMEKYKFDALFSTGKIQVTFAKRRIAVSAESESGGNKRKEAFKRPADAVVKKSMQQHQIVSDSVNSSVLFQNLDREQKRHTVDEFYRQTTKAGDVIITQGEPGINFYVVESGSYDVLVADKYDRKAQPQKVASRGAGQNFGELALMYNAPRAATITCTEPGYLWVLNRYAFRCIVQDIGAGKLREYVRFMDQVPLLSPLARFERQQLAEALEEVSFKANETIFKQGDEGDAMYIVGDGEVNVFKKEDGEQEVKQVNTCKVGDYFGERALLNSAPRAASVVAKSRVYCLKLDRNAFQLILGPLEEILTERQEEYKSGGGGETKAADDNGYDSQDDMEDLLDRSIQFEDLVTVGSLGRGSFGMVTLVKHKSTGVTYALKAVSKQQIVDTCQQQHIMSEKQVMAKLSHPFFVNLVTTFNKKDLLYFLLEPSMGGELFTILRSHRLFSEATSKFYAAHVILGFEYMHSKDIVYRDLKPENLLLGADGYLKITDFGFAKHIKTKTWTLCGTPEYLAPEIVGGKGHGKGVDWWTVGILIYEMLASFTPFYHEDHMKMYARIDRCKVKFPSHLSREARDIIKGLLTNQPSKRLGVTRGGASMIKTHPWFKGFDWEGLFNKKLPAPIPINVKSKTDLSNFDAVEEDDIFQPYHPDGSEWDANF